MLLPFSPLTIGFQSGARGNADRGRIEKEISVERARALARSFSQLTDANCSRELEFQKMSRLTAWQLTTGGSS